MQLPKTENQYVELKQGQVSPRELAEEIVAFANGEGGEIWLGVNDRGKAVGLSRSDDVTFAENGEEPRVTLEL